MTNEGRQLKEAGPLLRSNTQFCSKNFKGLNVKILLLSFHGPLPLKICNATFPGHFFFYFFKAQPLFQYYYRHTICSHTSLSLYLLSSPILSRLSSKFVSSMCFLDLTCKIHFHYYHLDSSHHHLFQGPFVSLQPISLLLFLYIKFYSAHTKVILYHLSAQNLLLIPYFT